MAFDPSSDDRCFRRPKQGGFPVPDLYPYRAPVVPPQGRSDRTRHPKQLRFTKEARAPGALLAGQRRGVTFQERPSTGGTHFHRVTPRTASSFTSGRRARSRLLGAVGGEPWEARGTCAWCECPRGRRGGRVGVLEGSEEISSPPSQQNKNLKRFDLGLMNQELT